MSIILFKCYQNLNNFYGAISIFASFLFTVQMQKYSWNKRNDNKPMPDFLHLTQLHFLTPYYKFSNHIINLYICIIVLFFDDHLHIFGYTLGIVYVIRAILFSITIFPKPGLMKDKNLNSNAIQIFYNFISGEDTHIGFNNDLVISGHCSILVIISKYISYFYPTFEYQIYLWLITFFTSIFIILTKCHYSLDIVNAYVFSLFVFDNLVKYVE